MRAIRIDAVNQKVEVINFEGDYTEIYKQLDVDCFTCVGLGEETLYVDDEGLINGTENFFQMEGLQPLAGNGLILGTDAEGESIGTEMEVPKVRFMNRAEVTLMAQLGAFGI